MTQAALKVRLAEAGAGLFSISHLARRQRDRIAELKQARRETDAEQAEALLNLYEGRLRLHQEQAR